MELVPRLTLVPAPANEPVTKAVLKNHCRVATDMTDDDALILRLAVTARGKVETDTGRQLITATYHATLDAWPRGEVDMPLAPLRTVTGITYVDTAGATQTLPTTVYVVDAPSGPLAPRGRIALQYGQVWPTVRNQINAVTITFTAGYGDDGDAVPHALKQALLLLVAHWYENRETVVVGTISTPLAFTYESLTAPYRTFAVRMTA